MVTVFSQKFCPKCDELKKMLQDSNIEYEDKDIVEDHTAYAKMILNDIEETPAVMFGESLISGDVDNIFSKIKVLNNG